MSTSITATSGGPGSPRRSDREPFSGVDWSLFVAVSLLWGSQFLLIEIGLDAFHPGLITWARVALGAAALLVVRTAGVRIQSRDRMWVVVLSVVWVAIPYTLFPFAQQHINSATAGLLTGAVPLFAWLFGALFFDRRPRSHQLAGLVIGLGGVTLISIGSSRQGETAVIGVVLALIATAGFGYAANLASRLQRRYGSVATMRWTLMLATVWTAPFGLYAIPQSSFRLTPTIAVAVLGLVATGGGFVGMASLIGRVGGPRATIISYAIPAVALLLGVIVRAESVTLLAIAGLPLVLWGATLSSRREGRPIADPSEGEHPHRDRDVA